MTTEAVTEFDNLLKRSGFAVDYEITDDNFKTTTNPIAYRNISRIDAGEKDFYLLWSVIAPNEKPAEDKFYAAEININIALYSKDAWMFNKIDENVNTAAYKALLNQLQLNGWDLEFGSEYPEIANEGSNTYVNRKDLIITKTFIGG